MTKKYVIHDKKVRDKNHICKKITFVIYLQIIA